MESRRRGNSDSDTTGRYTDTLDRDSGRKDGSAVHTRPAGKTVTRDVASRGPKVCVSFAQVGCVEANLADTRGDSVHGWHISETDKTHVQQALPTRPWRPWRCGGNALNASPVHVRWRFGVVTTCEWSHGAAITWPLDEQAEKPWMGQIKRRREDANRPKEDRRAREGEG